MKRIIFNGGYSNINRIEEGMIEPTLNMLFIKDILKGLEFAFHHNEKMLPGEEYIYLVHSEEYWEFIGIIRDAPDQIVSTKTIKKLGNAVAVAIANEAKILKLKPEDEVRITIEPYDKKEDDVEEILANRLVISLEKNSDSYD